MSECICGRPLKGDSICAGCSHKLQVALGNISSYWADLDTVRTRQTRYGGTGGGRGGDKPLPADLRFLDWDGDGTRLDETGRNTIGTWARVVIAERPVIYGPTHTACLHITCSQARRSRPPRSDVPAACRYLLGHVDWIRTQHWAPEILDELTDLENRLRSFVDRPRDSWYAGPCTGCERVLYAKVGVHEVTCKDCNLDFHVKDRRAYLLTTAEDMYVPASTLARAVSWLGEEPLTARRIRVWKHRDMIEVRAYVIPPGSVGPMCELRPLYRLGDAIDLMASAQRLKAG